MELAGPCTQDVMVAKLVSFWPLLDLQPHLLSLMEAAPLETVAEQVLPLLMKEVIALKDWSDWGETRRNFASWRDG
eukprot:Skav215590  [mRNA]  locus=scaffold666:111069:111900:+ [translate_table: standard]